MTSNSKLGDFATCLTPLLCSVLVLGGACHSPPEDEPRGNAIAAVSADDTCIDSIAHEVPGGRCDERAAASCASGTDPESVASVTLSALLTECFLNENRLHVELEQGCATRFGLLIESPEAVDCIATHLAAGRYDCFGDLRCGEGVVSTLR